MSLISEITMEATKSSKFQEGRAFFLAFCHFQEDFMIFDLILRQCRVFSLPTGRGDHVCDLITTSNLLRRSLVNSSLQYQTLY